MDGHATVYRVNNYHFLPLFRCAAATLFLVIGIVLLAWNVLVFPEMDRAAQSITSDFHKNMEVQAQAYQNIIEHNQQSLRATVDRTQ